METLAIHDGLITTEFPCPLSYKEAMEGPHAKEWQMAIAVEFKSLTKNNTWILLNLPSNRTPIGCKCVFKTKYGSNNEIIKRKARLVAKGYSQQEGLDYGDTIINACFISLCRISLFTCSANGGYHGL